MERVMLTLAEWCAVARELEGTHTEASPPGLQERVRALIAQAPREWPDQPFALELDTRGAEIVQVIHASLTQRDPQAGQRVASVAEAVQIIHDHQQRP